MYVLSSFAFLQRERTHVRHNHKISSQGILRHDRCRFIRTYETVIPMWSTDTETIARIWKSENEINFWSSPCNFDGFSKATMNDCLTNALTFYTRDGRAWTYRERTKKRERWREIYTQKSFIRGFRHQSIFIYDNILSGKRQ